MKRKKKPVPTQPQTTFWGLNVNSIIQSVIGSVVVFLITTSIQQGRANHDLLISHSEKINSIQVEQARIKREYHPEIFRPPPGTPAELEAILHPTPTPFIPHHPYVWPVPTP